MSIPCTNIKHYHRHNEEYCCIVYKDFLNTQVEAQEEAQGEVYLLCPTLYTNPQLDILHNLTGPIPSPVLYHPQVA